MDWICHSGLWVYLGCTVALPTVPLPFTVQEPVFGPLPAARSRLQDWALRRFESLQNPPRGELPSVPGWLLSAPVTAGVLTTMTTTITSTVVMPSAFAGPVYLPYSGQAPSSELASAHPVQAAAGSQSLTTRINPVEVCLEVWTGPNGWHANFEDHSFLAA